MRSLLALGALAMSAPVLAEETGSATALIGPALNVSNLAKELKFYTEGLGMKILTQRGQPAHYETIVGFPANPRQANLILMSDETAKNASPLKHGNDFSRLVMRVTGLPAIVAKLRALGYTCSDVRGSVEAGYRIAMATDPEGFRLELVEVMQVKGN